jgi:hypothetical protein
VTHRSHAALAALLVACGGKDESVGRKDPVEEVTTQATLTVDDPGVEPRTLLRFARRAGQHAELRSLATFTWPNGDVDRKAAAFDVDVLEVVGGVTHARETLRSFDGPIDARRLVGMTTETWLDARGQAARPARIRLEAAPIQPGEKDPFPELTVVLPDVAVGVGAAWRLQIALQGDTTSAVEAKLVELAADHIRLRIAFRTELRHGSVVFDGKGDLEVRLNEPIVRASTVAKGFAVNMRPQFQTIERTVEVTR